MQKQACLYLWVVPFSCLLFGCRLLAPKVNETDFLIDDISKNQEAVAQTVHNVARELGFEDNTKNFTTALQPYFASNIISSYLLHTRESSPYLLTVAMRDLDTVFFWNDDFLNIDLLAKRLKEPTTQDSVSHYIRSRLSPSTINLLSHYAGGDNNDLKQALAADLDRITDSDKAIYDTNRFARVRLSSETSLLLARAPRNYHDTRLLNRLLIEDAYTQEIARHRGRELLEVSLAHRNITGSKTTAYLKAESRLTQELAESAGSTLRIQESSGWVP